MKIIQTSTTGVRQTFGRASGIVGPGLSFYIPFVQKITSVNNRVGQDEFTIIAKTSDDVWTSVALKVQSRIMEENTSKAFFSLDKPHQQLDAYVQDSVRSEVPRLTLNQLNEQKDIICNNVSAELSEKMGRFGWTIVNTLITSIDPPSEVKSAMNAVYASKCLLVAAKNEADARYIKEVRQAEADKERKRLQGEGVSAQRLAILKGYEESMSNMRDSLGLSPEHLADFVMRTLHLDTLESIGKSNNAKTVFLSHESESPLMKSNQV